MKRWLLIACLMSIVGWWMTHGEAASFVSSALRLSVEAGFQGYYKMGRWLPLRLQVEHNGADLQTEVSVKVGKRHFRRLLALPSPAKKHVVLDVFSDDWQDAFALTLMAADSVIATVNVPVTPLRQHDTLIVSLRGETGASSKIREDDLAGQESVMVHVATVSLPERWRGYDAVTGVMLDPATTRPLSPTQTRALTHWLLLGGQLLLTRPLVAQSPLAPLVAHLLSLAAPLTSQPVIDNTVRYPIGLGQLALTRSASSVVLDTDATENHRSWTNQISASLRPDASSLAHRDRHILWGMRPDAIDAKRRLGYLTAFFMLYVSVIVTLFKCLAWRHAPPWRRFVAISGVVLVFTGLSVVFGYAVQWGAVVSRENTLVHVFPNSTDIYLTTAAALWSPGKGTYALRTLSAAYVEVGQAAGERLAVQTPPQPGADVTRLRIPMALWSARHLFVERFASTPGFAVRSGDTVDELANQSTFNLSRCHLLRHDHLYRLPDIASGRTVRLPRHNAKRAETFDIRKQPVLLKRVLTTIQGTHVTQDANGQVVCVVEGSLPTLTGEQHRLQQQSDTVLIVHL